MKPMLLNQEIRGCKVSDNFGSAREWLMYEMLAYYMQTFYLIIVLIVSEFKDVNIYKEETNANSPELIE